MIWYKFHIGDYLTHTVHLSDAEDLAYRRLMDLYYMSEKEIPLDTESVARKIRLDLDITESVLNEFFEKTETGYFNNRCHVEVTKYQHQVENNRQLGKRGGRPSKTESVIESKANHNPKKIQIQNIKTISSQATASRFEEFWNNWPTSKRKVAKSACKAKWERQALDPLTDKINAVVTLLKVSEQWISGFEPSPLTFINQKRWEDGSTTDSVSIGRRVI
tara:strand:+ start:1865 stop:2521 length:657 start_codon:yes stop_codon:yes gene_type:complete